LVSGAYKKGKRNNKCEDSYFISKHAFGVSDGVSGWKEYGFSSEEFSKQLMANAKTYIEKAFYELRKEKFIQRTKKYDKNGKKNNRKMSILLQKNDLIRNRSNIKMVKDSSL